MPLVWATAKHVTPADAATLPHVAIVLLNWNQARLTIECLESLFRLDYPRYTVVVCDNNSTDGSVDEIRRWAGGEAHEPLRVNPDLAYLSSPPTPKPIRLLELTAAEASGNSAVPTDARLILIHAGDNLGFTGGNNLGMKYVALRADIPLTWILNNDTVVAADSLRHLVMPIVNAADVGAVGATMFEYREPQVIQAAAGGAFSPRQLFPSLVG